MTYSYDTNLHNLKRTRVSHTHDTHGGGGTVATYAWLSQIAHCTYIHTNSIHACS